MKAKVVIENGETEIVLTPENEFEKGVLEKVYARKSDYSICTTVDAKYTYGHYDNHKMIVNLKEVR